MSRPVAHSSFGLSAVYTSIVVRAGRLSFFGTANHGERRARLRKLLGD